MDTKLNNNSNILLQDDAEYDVVLTFDINNVVRAKIIRMNQVSSAILSRFDTHNAEINSLFLQSIALSVAISSNFKFDGTFKVQITSDDSIVRSILVDSKINGDVRAYLSLNDHIKYDSTIQLSYKDLVGNNASMLVHADHKMGTPPYQSIVALSGNNIEDSFNNWFNMSEQTTTHVLSLAKPDTGEVFALFLQLLPALSKDENDKEESNIQNIELLNTIIILAKTLTIHEAFNNRLQDLIYKLFNEFDVVIYDRKPIYDRCSCSPDKIEAVISQLPAHEKDALRNEAGHIESTCSFCKRVYYID